MVENQNNKILTFLNDKECLICMTEFSSDQKITFCPYSYKHYFHSECLLNWFKTSKACPKCNTPISIEYINSRKDEYNIKVIEKNIFNDQSCFHKKLNPNKPSGDNELDEKLNEQKVSVVIATKEGVAIDANVVSILQSDQDVKRSLEPFAYGAH